MTLRVGALLAAVLLTVCAAPAFAQVSGGVKIGANFGDLSFSADDPSADEDIEDFEEYQDKYGKRRVGLVVGGFVNVPVTETFSFQPEFLYNQKGMKNEGDFDEDFGEILTGRFEEQLKLDQIQIPLLAKFTMARMGVRPFVVAGPAVGFTVRAREKREITDLELDGDPFTPNAEELEFLEENEFIVDRDVKDELKSVELSLIVGGGVRFGKASVEIRYDHGLSNLNDEVEEEGFKVKTRSFGILFGYSF